MEMNWDFQSKVVVHSLKTVVKTTVNFFRFASRHFIEPNLLALLALQRACHIVGTSMGGREMSNCLHSLFTTFADAVFSRRGKLRK